MALRNKKKIDFLNIALYLGIVAAVIFLASELIKTYKKYRAKQVSGDGGTQPSSSNGTPQTAPPLPAAIDYDKKLKFGVNAKPEVKILQGWVNRDGGKDAAGKMLVIDGIFGQKTKDALYNIKSLTEVSLNTYKKLPIKKPNTGGYDGSGINPTSNGAGISRSGNLIV